jgi:hypothetical protein
MWESIIHYKGRRIPEHLLQTYQMLECAFPNGVGEDDYYPLMFVLAERASIRSAATHMALIRGEDSEEYWRFYNDVLYVLSASAHEVVTPEAVAQVKQQLIRCGLDEILPELPPLEEYRVERP